MKISRYSLILLNLLFLLISGLKAQTNIFPASGNVGIGTTSPSVKLHVFGGNFLVNGGTGDANSGIRIVAPIATTHYNWMLGANQNVNAAFEITPSTAIGGTTFSTPALLVNSSGNVGIGTSTPLARLAVYQDFTDANVVSDIGSYGLNIGSSVTATTGNIIPLSFTALGGSNRARASIAGIVGADWGKMALGFYTKNASNGTALDVSTERMRITEDGNIGIGTTSPGAKLEIVGAVRLNPGATGYYAEHDYLGTTYNFGISEVSDNVRFNIAGGGTWTAGGGFNFQLAGSTKLRIHKDGNIGIGTTSPGARLDVRASGNSGNQFRVTDTDGASAAVRTYSTNDGDGLILNQYYAVGGSPYLRNADFVASMSDISATQMRFFTKPLSGTPALRLLIDKDGNVGIGTTTPSEKLFINGNIKAQKVIVTQIGWSDYVFNKDYKLRSLQNLEAFINQYKHLPEVPTAKEVEAKGISVGDNQALLLRKIEELTLYVIELNKRIAVFEKK